MKKNKRSYEAQDNVIELFPGSEVRRDIKREQEKFSNYRRNKNPRQALKEIADCLESNLIYIVNTGDIESGAVTQIEIIAYLRDWIA
jgi:hypothetical protein